MRPGRRQPGLSPSAFRLNRPGLQFARAPAYIGSMDDLTYWTEKLRQAEQELRAARKRTEVNEAVGKAVVLGVALTLL